MKSYVRVAFVFEFCNSVSITLPLTFPALCSFISQWRHRSCSMQKRSPLPRQGLSPDSRNKDQRVDLNPGWSRPQNLCSSAFFSCHLSCQRSWRPDYLLLLFLKVLLPRNQQLVFIPYTCWNRKSLLKLKVIKINGKINVHIEGHRYCSEGSILVCCCTVHSKDACFLYMEVTTIK